MALNVTGLERVFKHKDKTLSDPDAQMIPDEVMSFYSNTYPELTTSNLHGPKIEEDKAIYEFKSVVGTKG
ncbi:PRTRC system protein C [Bacteroides sp. 51]|uniref:PRTRC system protein C n=1 Tax=Bacteroides sp. 51 TaxID=2302938 RepID=UPI0013D78668|nr:PRTRC system protein C [Bacteroides sp. 51]NDV81358.1 PRTRC system protein C [Bacteroides sp. 51]